MRSSQKPQPPCVIPSRKIGITGPHRLLARIPDFHSGETGSIPVGGTLERILVNVWSICRCYVWLLVSPGINGKGQCGRCGETPEVLNAMITSKEEALEIYFEWYGKYPEPITVK